MKICRYTVEQDIEYGILEGQEIIALKGDPFSGIEKTDRHHKLADVTLLSPAVPSKVVAVGLNYQEHINEAGMDKPDAPILFMKPSTSVIGPGESIIYPRQAARVRGGKVRNFRLHLPQ